MAKKDFFRITDTAWGALKDALGTRRWAELEDKHRAVVKALVKAGFAEESSVDLDTCSADIGEDLDKLQSVGLRPTVITVSDLVMRNLSKDLRTRMESAGVTIRVQKTATAWRIASERAS